MDDIRVLNDRFATAPTGTILEWAWERFGSRAAIGTSFQGAGLVLMHLARSQGLSFPLFTIDTGLLFAETLALQSRLESFFGCAIESLTPELGVEEQARRYGADLWAKDPDLCCTLRKVWPLRQKLESLDCWITGLRREQSSGRTQTQVVESYRFDAAPTGGILKLNPMAGWSREAVWQYIRQHQIPYNPLHDRGYHSIGCAPCTRPTGKDESERAGRWFGFNKTECGIHSFLTKQT
jgi:phosphoadenosine phosphosulfate reductase